MQGWVVKPPNFDPSKKYPMILEIHGGPSSATLFEMRFWIYGRTLFAARGYALLSPNYRGSTGRGLEFAKTSQADPAGKEFDDLVDAVDHLIEGAFGYLDTILIIFAATLPPTEDLRTTSGFCLICGIPSRHVNKETQLHGFGGGGDQVLLAIKTEQELERLSGTSPGIEFFNGACS